MSYEASQSSLIPASRNGLAPRGGLAFDGAAGTRASATLTNQNIGTDAFSVSLVFNAPAYAGTTKMLARLSSVSGGAGGVGSALTIYVDTALTFHFRNAAHDGYIQGAVDFTPYYGKVVHVVGVRSGATFVIYINGTSVAFSPSSGGNSVLFSQSLVTTYFEVGGYITTSVPVSAIYAATLYNCALAQADVAEIYESGGAVPERFKFGTQANVYASDWSAGLDGWGSDGTETGNNDGVTDGTTSYNDVLKTVYGAASISRVYGGPAHTIGKAYRVTGKVYLPNTNSNIRGIFANLDVTGASSNPIAAFPQSTANPLHNIRGTWTAFSGEYVASNAGQQITWWGLNSAGGYSTAALNDEVNFKDYAVKRIGAVVHLDGESDGIGYQWHDQSTNKLDAWVSSSGVAWTKPRRDGYLRTTLTWAGTHEAKNLSGEPISAVCMPVTAIVTGVTTKSSAASSGSGLSIAAEWNSANLVALNAFSTVKKIHALLGGAVPNGNNDPRFTRYWIDPDTANFTGSIDVDLRYSDTNGNP